MLLFGKPRAAEQMCFLSMWTGAVVLKVSATALATASFFMSEPLQAKLGHRCHRLCALAAQKLQFIRALMHDVNTSAASHNRRSWVSRTIAPTWAASAATSSSSAQETASAPHLITHFIITPPELRRAASCKESRSRLSALCYCRQLQINEEGVTPAGV